MNSIFDGTFAVAFLIATGLFALALIALVSLIEAIFEGLEDND